MNNVQTASIIKSLCKERHITINAFLEDCNIRKSLIYDMEKRDKTPSPDILERIANYFNCSVDYLIGRNTQGDAPTSTITGTPNESSVFFDKLQLLCAEKGIRITPLLQELGLSSGAISRWKAGTLPNGETLLKLASRLDCSVDYLLGNDEQGETFSNVFWERYTELCKAVGKSPNVVANEIGIKSSGTVTGWKNGAMPRVGVLSKLAMYFDVSVQDLTGEQKEKPSPIVEEGQDDDMLEKEFMRWFRVQSPDRQKEVLFDLAKAVTEHGE